MKTSGRAWALGLPIVVVLGVLSYFLLGQLFSSTGSNDGGSASESVAPGDRTSAGGASGGAAAGEASVAVPIRAADTLPGSNEVRNRVADLPDMLSSEQLTAVAEAEAGSVLVIPVFGVKSSAVSGESSAGRIFSYDVSRSDTAAVVIAATGFGPEALVQFQAAYLQSLPDFGDSPATQATSMMVRADDTGAVAFVVEVAEFGRYQVATAAREETAMAQDFVVAPLDADISALEEWLEGRELP